MKRLLKKFTLVEMLTVLGVIALAAAILLPALVKARQKSSQITCMNNIRNLSLGIQMFYNRNGSFPHDELSEDLADLFPAGDNTFSCPVSGESYDNYYIAREKVDQDRYFLGCPHHKIVNFAPGTGTGTSKIGKILLNGNPVQGGQDLTTGDVVTFADGSTVTITDGEAKIVTSFWKSDGGLYSILRIFEDESGNETTIDAQVTEGVNSDLEVVTPAAIAGVVGTEFNITSRYNATDAGYETDLTVSKGGVKLTGRKGNAQWEPVVVKGGQSLKKKSTKGKVHKNPKGKKK